MNKLITGALFSSRLAVAKRRRNDFRARKIKQGMTLWERAADGFEKNDPDGTKLAGLLAEAVK